MSRLCLELLNLGKLVDGMAAASTPGPTPCPESGESSTQMDPLGGENLTLIPKSPEQSAPIFKEE